VVRTTACLPAVRAAWPEAEIRWLVEPPAAGALAGRPELDGVLVFPRPRIVAALRRGRGLAAARMVRAFAGRLRAHRFDLAIDFHSIARSALLARWSGARERVGLAPPDGRELSWWLATRRVGVGARRLSRFARNQALLDALGAPMPEGASGRWAVAAGRGEGAVVLHPGSSAGAPYKRYPVDRYARLATELGKRFGVSVWVVHGPGEGALARAVTEASEGAARLAPATGGVDELAELLAGASVFVGSDSGPLHVASLVGTPVVQLLGPTDPVENEPWPGTPWRRVEVPLACRPCRRGCAAATCMREIRPEAVAEAVGELLAEAPT